MILFGAPDSGAPQQPLGQLPLLCASATRGVAARSTWHRSPTRGPFIVALEAQLAGCPSYDGSPSAGIGSSNASSGDQGTNSGSTNVTASSGRLSSTVTRRSPSYDGLNSSAK